MELLGLNESPPTGVLNNMNKTNLNTTLNNNKVSNLNSTANTNLNSLNAAVFTNLSNSNNCELNNSNLGLSTSSFSLALNNQQANKFSTTPNSLNSNNLNNLNCSLSSKNNLSPLNSAIAKQQTDFLNQTDNLQNYLNNCDIKLGDLNKQSDFINSLNSHNNQQKSSSSNCVNSNSLTNSISTNSSPNLFCAQQQQLFNQQTTNSQQQFNLQQQLNNQQKVKRTRQRVDAGEPRNSYASIANYASNRLVGKTSSKQFQQFQKGLFDQYLGNLNNLLTSNGQFNLDEFLLSTNSTNQLINNQSINNLLANLTNDKNFNQLELNQFQQLNQQKLNNQMILNQSFNNWNTNSAQQSDLKLTNSDGANNLESQQQNLDQQTMAKSRFSEDAVALDYNVKVSKHSEFLDNNTEPIDSSPMIINQMDSTDEQNKIETQETDSVQEMQVDEKLDDKQINDENDKNTENNPTTKSPQISETNSRSESLNSSRCSSPITQLDQDDDKDKRNRVDDIVNNLNLVAERINSNSSCNSTNGSLNNDKNGITKLNGNCKNRRKLNQPQQCKTTDDDDDLNEINQMNQDDKDDLYKDDLDDEDCLDDEMNDSYSATGQQQLDNLRKLANSANLNNSNDLEKLKAWETLLQQIQLNQQPQLNPFNSQLNQQFNQQFNAINQQLNSNNQLNNSNHSSANLRSTRVSDRGRLNGQINSNNNSANSTPVNLSINSPKLDDDDYLLNLTKNSDFYNDSKDNFTNLSANLTKEFTILIEDLQKSICSRKLTNSLQDKLRLRFDQFLNGNDVDLEQFFTNTKEHLINSVVQIVDNSFQRYKTKVYMQNINGTFNSLNQFNQLNHLSNNLNQSSKNLLALNKQPIHQPQQPSQRKQDRTINENNTNSNLRTNSTTNLVEQLNNRLQRSSPNLLAGLNNLDNITAANVTANNLATNKLFQNLNSNLNSSLQSNVSSLLGGADFKTPFSNFLQDNNLLQLLHAQQEEQLQLQNKLQKENQQDSNSLSLMAPKRKRIKASDEPRRTRTSNRLPNSQNNQINSLTSQINSLNSINQTLNSMTPKTTQEVLNLVSRELNNTTPLHNLNQSTNTSLNSQNNQNDLERDASAAAAVVNRQSTNNNVFPFNNSFINSLNQGDLDVQQLMLAVNNGLNNNSLNNGQVNSNRASPLSSFGNLSSGQYMLDNSPDNSLNNNDLDGAESTTTLSPVHLRKAKLMFFYVRYPSSNVLKTYFRDIKFNKNNTAQLVKWFSNFREFYYQQIDKHARQELSNGRQNAEDIHLPADSELLKVLNVHYNRQNHISVPESFRAVVEQTVREFFRSIKEGRDDSEPSWRKPIYKVIARLDTTVPECFRQPNFLDALESNNYTEL